MLRFALHFRASSLCLLVGFESNAAHCLAQRSDDESLLLIEHLILPWKRWVISIHRDPNGLSKMRYCTGTSSSMLSQWDKLIVQYWFLADGCHSWWIRITSISTCLLVSYPILVDNFFR